MLGDPAAGSELLEQRIVEPARRSVVDVLDRRLTMTQPGAAHPPVEALGVAGCSLAVEQQRQPATDVVVRYRRSVRGGCGPFAIEVGLQDRGEICLRVSLIRGHRFR